MLKIKVKLCKNQDYSFSEDHDRTFLDQWRFLRLRGFFILEHFFDYPPSFSHPHFLFSRCSFSLDFSEIFKIKNLRFQGGLLSLSWHLL